MIESFGSPRKVIDFAESIDHEDMYVGWGVEEITRCRYDDLPVDAEIKSNNDVDDVDDYGAKHKDKEYWFDHRIGDRLLIH